MRLGDLSQYVEVKANSLINKIIRHYNVNIWLSKNVRLQNPDMISLEPYIGLKCDTLTPTLIHGKICIIDEAPTSISH